MKKYIRTVFLVLAVLSTMVPAVCSATTIWHYEVSGIGYLNGSQVDIVGGMNIAFSLGSYNWNGSPKIDTSIVDFQLVVDGQYNFEGYGDITIMDFGSPYGSGQQDFYTENWSLTGNGDWTSWGTLLSEFHLGLLDLNDPWKIIKLGNMGGPDSWATPNPALHPNAGSFNLQINYKSLTLTRTNAVPEPSALLLLGSGLLGLVGLKRRRKA